MIFEFDYYLNSVSFYDDNRQKICNLHGDISSFAVFTFSEKKRIVATQNDCRQNVIIWSMDTGLQIYSIFNTECLYALTFSNDGSKLLGGTDNGIIKIWDMNTRMVDLEIELTNNFIYFIKNSPNEKYYLVGTDNSIIMLDSKKFEIIRSFKINIEKIYTVYFSNDGKYIAVSTWEYIVSIYNTITGDHIQDMEDIHQFIGVKFSNGNYIATKHFNDIVKVWKLGKKDYIFSYKERKFKSKFQIEWKSKKIELDKEYKNQIKKSLNFFPEEILKIIIDKVKYKNCLTANGKIIFID